MRCLEKDRRKRITDISTALFVIDESAISLQPAGSADAGGRSASRTLWRRAIPFVITAVIVSALVGAIAWFLRPATAPLTVARFSMTLPEGQQFTNDTRSAIAISPDGTQLVYVANYQLYRRSISDFEARPIPGTEIKEGIANPVFAPDGRSIAFYSVADNTIKRIGIDGGMAVAICPADNPFGMSWGENGIVFGQGTGGGVLRVSPNGGAPERLVTVKQDEIAHGPQILPGGQAVLFTLASNTSTSAVDRFEKAKIVLQSLKTGERTTLLENGSDARYLPTGHLVYALNGTLLAVPFDVRQQKVSGGPVSVLEGIRRSTASGTGTAQFSVSGNGSLAYVPGPVSFAAAGRTLIVSDRNGAIAALPVAPAPYLHPRVSRDGKHVAVSTDDGKETNVWIYELPATSSIRRLTFAGHNRSPIWSPDGQRVAFQSDREGDLSIFVQRADGAGAAERLTKPERDAAHTPESWSPDGRTLLFSAKKDGVFSLWAVSLDDRKVVPFGNVHSAEPIDAMFSPDGHWIVYSSNDKAGATPSPNRGVYIQPFPSTGARYQVPKQRLDFHPSWDPSGTSLYYIPVVNQFSVIDVRTQPALTFGTAMRLRPLPTRGLSTDVRDYDVLPDGRFLSVSLGSDVSGTNAQPQINVVLNWYEELKQSVPVQ
jgi:eukaryotic-like serine/threonine-protein kinase